MSSTKARRTKHKKLHKKWSSSAPYSVNTQNQLAGDDYFVRNLEEIRRGYYKEEGRREAVVDQRLNILEEKTEKIGQSLAEVRNNLAIILMIGKLINRWFDWLKSKNCLIQSFR